jgi:hypothetical protein
MVAIALVVVVLVAVVVTVEVVFVVSVLNSASSGRTLCFLRTYVCICVLPSNSAIYARIDKRKRQRTGKEVAEEEAQVETEERSREDKGRA